jgi:hypothetical protein
MEVSKMCRAEILSNDPNPHTIVCSTYYPYYKENIGTNATPPYFWKENTDTNTDYPYWQKTYYPDYIVIHLDEPVKMDIKVKGKATLKFSDGREIVIKAGDE